MRSLDPRAAWMLLQQNPEAVLVDCRTEIEVMHVGHPFDPEFVDKVKQLVRNDLNRPVLLVCRSGHRSACAGDALEMAGFSSVINIVEGFEGPLDENYHRGKLGGWRFFGLPWQQS